MPSDEFSRAITPQEKKRIEFERQQKAARDEHDKTQDFFAEIGEEFISRRGKAIMRSGNTSPADKKEDKFFSALGSLVSTPMDPARIIKAIQNSSIILSSVFVAKASTPDPRQHFHEDKDYVYDTAPACPRTYRTLETEAAEIEEKLRQLAAIENEDARNIFAHKITMLAEKYQMRRHPVTNRYVHDIARVEAEERIHNPHNSVEGANLVCVYRIKAHIGDPRGVTRKIGDVCNQDPEEAIASGDHLKGQNPSYAPSR